MLKCLDSTGLISKFCTWVGDFSEMLEVFLEELKKMDGTGGIKIKG
jgi:hypothetical protein